MTATKIKSEGALCFKIHGDWLTEHCRSLWADEKRPDQAIKTLMCVVENEAQALLILCGKKKLEGVNKLAFLDDDATTSAAGNKLLNLEQTLARFLRHEQRLQDDMYDQNMRMLVASPMGQVSIGVRAYERIKKGESDWDNEVWEKVPSLLDRTEATVEKRMRKAKRDMLFPKTPIWGERMLDSFLNKMKEEDDLRDIQPKEDKELNSLNGWVDREGRFWPCNYMGHIGLAKRLGFGERFCEEDGWLKISDSRDPLCIIPRDSDVIGLLASHKYTEKQRGTILAWCQKHNRPFPQFLKEED